MNQSEVRVQFQKALRKSVVFCTNLVTVKHHKEKSIQNFGYKCVNMRNFFSSYLLLKVHYQSVPNPLTFTVPSSFCIFSASASVTALTHNAKGRTRDSDADLNARPKLLSTASHILPSQNPRNPLPLPSPSSDAPSTFLRELKFSINNFIKCSAKNFLKTGT